MSIGPTISCSTSWAGAARFPRHGCWRLCGHGFDADGSDYTPVLDATQGMASRDVLEPAGTTTMADDTADWAGHPTRARFLAFDMRRVPDPAADPALRLPATTPLRALRRDKGGRMVFVNAAKRFYGWVAGR